MMTEEEIERATPNELVEEGVGLIARGLFRENALNGPASAAGMGSDALTVVRACWFDFLRKSGGEEAAP